MSLSTRAMVLLARGENEDARATVEHAVSVARELNGPLVLFPALQLLAVAENRLDRTDDALKHLREGMRIARETRCVTGWPLLSVALFVELAELALASGIEVAHTQAIVAKLRLRPRSPAIHAWPWPLRLRTLGRFEVARDGTALFMTEPFASPIAIAGRLSGVLDFTINKQDVDLVLMLYELRSTGEYVKLFDPAKRSGVTAAARLTSA